MSRIIVCPLSQLPDSVETHSASHLVTLLKDVSRVQRPQSIVADRHLVLSFDDITEPMEGMVAPSEDHAQKLISFVGSWSRDKPLVIHCYAGISRSTAAAYISLCALRPEMTEEEVARSVRTASPSATPNRLLVSFADRILGRKGRMIEAIGRIGRGETAYEGVPFSLSVDDR